MLAEQVIRPQFAAAQRRILYSRPAGQCWRVLCDEYERIGPADSAMAMQNRIGERANDFRYTLLRALRNPLRRESRVRSAVHQPAAVRCANNCASRSSGFPDALRK